MAQIRWNVEVDSGPEVYRMLLGCLRDGKPVRFHLAKKLKAGIMGPPIDYLYVQIITARRTSPAMTVEEKWVILGEVLHPDRKVPVGLLMKGTFNTKDRSGKFVVRERKRRNGDLRVSHFLDGDYSLEASVILEQPRQ